MSLVLSVVQSCSLVDDSDWHESGRIKCGFLDSSSELADNAQGAVLVNMSPAFMSSTELSWEWTFSAAALLTTHRHLVDALRPF